MSKSISHWFSNHNRWIVVCVVLAVVSLILGIPHLYGPRTPALRMSAGPNDTRRHVVASYFTEQAAKNDLKIELQSNGGSEDCLNLLKSGQLDLAVVSNGVVVPDDENITVLAAVQTEYLHVLVRKTMAASGGPIVDMIRGKRVNLGQKGSTERLLAEDLIASTRIKLPSETHAGDIIPTEFSKTELIAKARAILKADATTKASMIAELPDCLLILASLPSNVAQLLVEAADYQIVPMVAIRSYLIDNLQDKHEQKTIVDRVFLNRVTIPANSYFLNRGYPATDIDTIGIRMLIVARKDLPAASVRSLMKTLYESEFSRRITSDSPRDVSSPYAIHPAAEAYLDRDKPLLVQSFLEQFTKWFSIFGALSALALSLYGLMKKKRIRKPSDYYAEIRKVELIARGAATDPAAPIQPQELMRYLDDRLVHLRSELIEDICEGRLKADQVIANILTLLKETRRNLPHTEVESATVTYTKPRIAEWMEKKAV